MLFLLLAFSGLIGRLELLGRSGGFRRFGVIPAIYHPLGLNFVRSDVIGSTSLEDLLINFLYVRTWL